MSIIAREQEKPLAPDGQYLGVVVDIIDLGLKEDRETGKKRPRALFVYMLDTHDEETGDQYEVSESMNVSLNPRSRMRARIDSWNPLTDAQVAAGFPLDSLIGKSLQIGVKRNKGGDGRIYANVNTTMPLGKSQQPLAPPEDYVRAKDRPKSAGAGDSRPDGSPIS